MNPGIPEEVGQTARSFLEIMKQQPALIGMIVANVTLLVFMFYALVKAAEFRDNMLRGNLEYQKHVSELLSRCVIPMVPREP